jgi:multidrug transporter EmrE-like cation transporter
MSFIYVLAMTAAELIGNAHLKWFADEGKHHNLMFGVMAWMAVLFFLIKTLSSSSMMWTCIMWEAMITILGSLVAYFYLNERFDHWVQYFGIVLALVAMALVHYGGNLKK